MLRHIDFKNRLEYPVYWVTNEGMRGYQVTGEDGNILSAVNGLVDNNSIG